MGAFCPPKSTTPIVCVLCVGGNLALMMIKCEECHEWTDEHCKSVADYVEKLSLQCERKERKTKSSSFSGFSPSMLVPLGQLPSPADSGVVTSLALSSAVCVAMFLVAGPTGTAAPVVSMPSVAPIELSHKWRRVMDPKERELMVLHFDDLWASGKSTPRMGQSSASQPHLITLPMVVPAPVRSAVPAAVAIPLAVAHSASSRSAESSSR